MQNGFSSIAHFVTNGALNGKELPQETRSWGLGGASNESDIRLILVSRKSIMSERALREAAAPEPHVLPWRVSSTLPRLLLQ